MGTRLVHLLLLALTPCALGRRPLQVSDAATPASVSDDIVLPGTEVDPAPSPLEAAALGGVGPSNIQSAASLAALLGGTDSTVPSTESSVPAVYTVPSTAGPVAAVGTVPSTAGPVPTVTGTGPPAAAPGPESAPLTLPTFPATALLDTNDAGIPHTVDRRPDADQAPHTVAPQPLARAEAPAEIEAAELPSAEPKLDVAETPGAEPGIDVAETPAAEKSLDVAEPPATDALVDEAETLDAGPTAIDGTLPTTADAVDTDVGADSGVDFDLFSSAPATAPVASPEAEISTGDVALAGVPVADDVAPAPASAAEPVANLLFTMSAKRVTLTNLGMLMEGVSPVVSFVSDVPLKHAGRFNTSFFTGPAFAENGTWLSSPDAVLMGVLVAGGDAQTNGTTGAVVLKLQSSPVYNASRYTIRMDTAIQTPEQNSVTLTGGNANFQLDQDADKLLTVTDRTVFLDAVLFIDAFADVGEAADGGAKFGGLGGPGFCNPLGSLTSFGCEGTYYNGVYNPGLTLGR